MAKVFINKIPVDVDVEDEIYQYIEYFERYKISNNKLISCSPFRNEKHPSFYIDLEQGFFKDSGAEIGDYYEKGNIIKLLSFLRGETFEDVGEYLLEKYNHNCKDINNIKLDLKIKLEQKKHFKNININKLDKEYKSNYLKDIRGISEKIIKQAYIYQEGNTVNIPWLDFNKNINCIKKRNINKKYFYYDVLKRTPLTTLFGLELIHHNNYKNIECVAICEGEIDALTFREKNILGLAVGKGKISKQQLELIKSIDFKNIIVAGDNDIIGEQFNKILISELKYTHNLFYCDYLDTKDINEYWVKYKDIPELKRVNNNVKLNINK